MYLSQSVVCPEFINLMAVGRCMKSNVAPLMKVVRLLKLQVERRQATATRPTARLSISLTVQATAFSGLQLQGETKATE